MYIVPAPGMAKRIADRRRCRIAAAAAGPMSNSPAPVLRLHGGEFFRDAVEKIEDGPCWRLAVVS
jgi:hypothetical protein